MSQEKLKVLFISGGQRSGSTILLRALGQLPGYFAAGELWYIWERGLAENRLCGCERPFQTCDFWQQTFSHAFGSLNSAELQQMVDLINRGIRTRHIPYYLTEAGKQSMQIRLKSELNHLHQLYKAVQANTGCRVIVDSSKNPVYGYLLSLIPEIELHVIHLIRDSRAVAYSWQRKKLQIDTEAMVYMAQMSPSKSAIMWNVWNLATERFRKETPQRYFKLLYTDWITHPLETLQNIMALTGETADPVHLQPPNKIYLENSHTISGNPNRFQTGWVTLRLDEEWREKLNKRDRITVTTLTAPLLKRYQLL